MILCIDIIIKLFLLFIFKSMTYSGRYKVSNLKKYKGDFNSVYYRSMWERACFKWCDESPKVKEWSSEEVVIPYFYDVDKKYHRYFMDLKIKTNENKIILVEIKPDKQTRPPEGQRKTKQYIAEGLTYVKNQCKWRAAKEYADDRKWDFQIWTEHTLQQMGILSKPVPGKLKKLKAFPSFKKRRKK